MHMQSLIEEKTKELLGKQPDIRLIPLCPLLQRAETTRTHAQKFSMPGNQQRIEPIAHQSLFLIILINAIYMPLDTQFSSE